MKLLEDFCRKFILKLVQIQSKYFDGVHVLTKLQDVSKFLQELILRLNFPTV